MNLEIREINLENVTVDDDKRTISGRAVPYNSYSRELRTVSGDKFVEIILPGAASESVKTNDVLALKDHDTALILGRTSASTLRLEEREDGIYYSIDMPDTSYGRDTLVSAKRGDLKAMSFGFIAVKQRNYSKDGKKVRELSAIDLKEISIVANPAYESTSLAVRSEDFTPEVTATPEVPAEPAKPDNRDKDYALRLRLLSLTHQQ
jgi:HK97 family phage prohead protease